MKWKSILKSLQNENMWIKRWEKTEILSNAERISCDEEQIKQMERIFKSKLNKLHYLIFK